MGALTLKTFSDELREWEFIEGESIDPTDSFGSDLRVSVRENQIFLAEPGSIDMPWITDRGRLFFDGMFNKSSPQHKTPWQDFFNQILESVYFVDHLNLQQLSPSLLFFVLENVSLETLSILGSLEQKVSVVQLRKAENHLTPNDFENQFQISQTSSKSCLAKSTLGIVINTNTRYEGYLLNLTLRQRLLKGNFKIIALNSLLDLTFSVYNLGSSFKVLKSMGEGTHLACQDLKSSFNPVLITNTEIYKRSDSLVLAQIMKYTSIINSVWSGFNVLNHSLSSTGISYLSNIRPLTMEDNKNFFGLYLINTSLDSVPNIKYLTECGLLKLSYGESLLLEKFVVDQKNIDSNKSFFKNSLSSCRKSYFNYFHFPNNLFLEDSETYINTQGLVKRATKLIDFKKDAKTNWQILRKFYNKFKLCEFLSNKQNPELVQFEPVNLFDYKNYIHFQYQAGQTLTSLSFYIHKQSKPLNSYSINCLIKNNKVKLVNSKLKNWLDNFFTGEGKDFYSYKSSVLVNSCKILQKNSTNFF